MKQQVFVLLSCSQGQRALCCRLGLSQFEVGIFVSTRRRRCMGKVSLWLITTGGKKNHPVQFQAPVDKPMLLCYILITRASCGVLSARWAHRLESTKKAIGHLGRLFNQKGKKRWLNSRHLAFRMQIKSFQKKRCRRYTIKFWCFFFISKHIKECISLQQANTAHGQAWKVRCLWIPLLLSRKTLSNELAWGRAVNVQTCWYFSTEIHRHTGQRVSGFLLAKMWMSAFFRQPHLRKMIH